MSSGTGKPGKDARAMFGQGRIIGAVIAVLVIGTLLMWLFHWQLP